MQAVILAAGRGTRMGALTNEVPKPMLPLLGRPMLEWKLEMLPKGVHEVVLIVGYFGEKIASHFGESFRGKKIRYVFQKELNGTWGALKATEPLLREKFLVTMGDDLYHPDDLLDLCREEAAVLCLEVNQAESFGLIAATKEGTLKKVVERPHGQKSGLVNTGAYCFDTRFFDYSPVAVTETEFGLPQTLGLMGQDVPVAVVLARAWQPVGRPEDIVLAERFLEKYWLPRQRRAELI